MKLTFDIVQTLLIAIIGIMNWLNTRQRVTNDTINKMEGRLDDRLDNHSERLTRMEADFKNMPNHYDLGKIYDQMRKMSDNLSELNASISAQLSGQKEAISALKENMVFWRSSIK